MERIVISTKGSYKARKHRSKNDPYYAWQMYHLIRCILMELYVIKDITLLHSANRHRDRKHDYSHTIHGKRVVDVMRMIVDDPSLQETYHLPRDLFTLRSLHKRCGTALASNISFHNLYHKLKNLEKEQEHLHQTLLRWDTLAEGISEQMNIALDSHALSADYKVMLQYISLKTRKN